MYICTLLNFVMKFRGTQTHILCDFDTDICYKILYNKPLTVIFESNPIECLCVKLATFYTCIIFFVCLLRIIIDCDVCYNII